jgi:Flp pilus assembly protein TadG
MLSMFGTHIGHDRLILRRILGYFKALAAKMAFCALGLEGFRRERRGVAMIEFGVTLPILVIMLLPMVDIGMGFYVQSQVATAAEAGAQYAFVKGWSGNNSATQTNIVGAVTSATGLSGIQATPAPVLSCGCVDGNTITMSTPNSPFTPSSCAGLATCTGSNNPQKPGAFVTVTAQANFQPIFTYWIFGGAKTLTATSTVRIQ